jgi:hypothetical protein
VRPESRSSPEALPIATGKQRTRRYALVVIAESGDAAQARRHLAKTLEEAATVYASVGDACPVGPATDYVTKEIRLQVDGELAVTVPDGEDADAMDAR